MTAGHRPIRTLALALTAGILALFAAAACGNKGNPVQIVQQDDGGGGGAGPGAANSAFVDCLREHGYAVPSGRASGFPRPSGSRRVRPSGFPRPSGGFPRPSGSDFRRPGGGFPTDIPSVCASLRPSFNFRDRGQSPSPSNAG